MSGVRPTNFQENSTNRRTGKPPQEEATPSTQSRILQPEGRRRGEKLGPPGDAGQDVGSQEGGGKTSGKSFSSAPRDTFGEKTITPCDQMTLVGNP